AKALPGASPTAAITTARTTSTRRTKHSLTARRSFRRANHDTVSLEGVGRPAPVVGRAGTARGGHVGPWQRVEPVPAGAAVCADHRVIGYRLPRAPAAEPAAAFREDQVRAFAAPGAVAGSPCPLRRVARRAVRRRRFAAFPRAGFDRSGFIVDWPWHPR